MPADSINPDLQAESGSEEDELDAIRSAASEFDELEGAALSEWAQLLLALEAGGWILRRPTQPPSNEERYREAVLRLADAYAVLKESIQRDEDGYPDEDWMEMVEGHLGGGFFSALDFALTGGQGCLDDEEFEDKRRAALEKHREELNVAALQEKTP